MTYSHLHTIDEEPLTFLCPNCSWRAEGKDLTSLRQQKDAHAMYECPLPQRRAS